MSRKTLLVGASGLLAGLALGPLQSAFAGHTNTVLVADLDGRNEVANGATSSRIVGDPDGTGEIYVFGIDGDTSTLCYVLLADGISGLDAPATDVAAHIHQGAAGVNGPVVVNLARPQDGQAADCLTEGEILPSGAPAFPTGATVSSILADPAGFYVNVHNPELPNGAVRGQLEVQGHH